MLHHLLRLSSAASPQAACNSGSRTSCSLFVDVFTGMFRLGHASLTSRERNSVSLASSCAADGSLQLAWSSRCGRLQGGRGVAQVSVHCSISLQPFSGALYCLEVSTGSGVSTTRHTFPAPYSRLCLCSRLVHSWLAEPLV